MVSALKPGGCLLCEELDDVSAAPVSPSDVASRKLYMKIEDAVTPSDYRKRKQARRQEAELAKARAQLSNIENAIRQGILTPTTKRMLEDAERRIAELEAVLKKEAVKRDNVAVLPSVVEKYLRELRGSLNRDPERARTLLAKLLGPITLRRDGSRLIAERKGTSPPCWGWTARRCIKLVPGARYGYHRPM